MNSDIEKSLERQTLRQPRAVLDERVFSLLKEEEEEIGLGERGVETEKPMGGWVIFGSAMAAMIGLLITGWVVLGEGGWWGVKSGPVDSPDVVSRDDGTGDGKNAIGAPVSDAVSPVEFVNHVSAVEPGEVIYLTNQMPVRTVRYQAVETRRWVDEKNNIRIEMTIPREDIHLIPMNLD